MGNLCCVSSSKRRSKDQVVQSPVEQVPESKPAQPTKISNFAVICTLFNPIQYQRRYEVYRQFEKHMAESNVQLITIECIFMSAQEFDLPKQKFMITYPNRPHHIQVRAPSILWIKENLVNIAVESLPANIEYVAWIDGDIEFENLDWPKLTIEELQRFPIVQLFRNCSFLGPAGKSDVLRQDFSFGYSIRENKPIDPKLYSKWYPHPGYCWAMRRSAFTQIGGLCSFCIIGSGDLHFAFGLLGRIVETVPNDLNPDYLRVAEEYQSKLVQVSQNGACVGYVPVNIVHYWHGSRDDRKYVSRWNILVEHNYSPATDLVESTQSGLRVIRFRESERLKALERDIVAYFKERNEDNPVSINEQNTSPKQQMDSVSRVGRATNATNQSGYKDPVEDNNEQISKRALDADEMELSLEEPIDMWSLNQSSNDGSVQAGSFY